MHIRNIASWILVFAAAAAAAAHFFHFRKSYRELGATTEAELIRRAADLSADDAAVLTGDSGRMRALAEKYPDRPWYLWQWWTARPSYAALMQALHSGVRPADSPPPGVIAADLAALRRGDPDNGAPLFYEAVFALFCDGEDEAGGGTGRADRAARLVSEAVTREKFTWHRRETARERLRLYGPMRSLGEMGFLSDLSPILMLPMHRHFADLLLAEAARRAEGPQDAGGLTAAEIVCSLQSLGVRLLLDAGDSAAAVYAQLVIITASEKGGALLREAGQTAAAEAVLGRGRELAFPRLAMLAAQNVLYGPGWKEHGDVFPLGETAELQTASEDLVRYWQGPVYARYREILDTAGAGFIFTIAAPLDQAHWPHAGPMIPEEEIEALARMEYWTYGEIVWTLLLLFLLPVFFSAGVHFQIVQDRKQAAPNFSHTAVLVQSILTAAVCSLPGLAVLWFGHGLLIPMYGALCWLVFWNIWAPACAVLLFARCENAGGGAAVSGIPAAPGMPGEKPAAAALLLSAAAAAVCYQARLDLGAGWLAAAGIPLAVCVSYLIRMLYWGRREKKEQARFSLHCSAGLFRLAGVILCLVASAQIYGYQKQAWLDRESLFIARNNCAWPLENRIAEAHWAHLLTDGGGDAAQQ